MKDQNLRLAGSTGIGIPAGQIIVWVLETFALAEPIPGEVAIAIGSVLVGAIHFFLRRKNDDASNDDDDIVAVG